MVNKAHPWSPSLSATHLHVGREGHVDLLPVRGDAVKQQRVVHGAVPGRLEAVEGPAARGRGRVRGSKVNLKVTSHRVRYGVAVGFAMGWLSR